MNRLTLFCFLVACSFSVRAQDRLVSGKVTDVNDGTPLPGVNVLVKGTTVGTVTDINGTYNISVPGESDMLVFSFIGMQTREESIGQRAVVDVQLSSDVTQLTGVLVTAQGIARKREALGFAVSEVSRDAIADKTESDVARSLRSKASGVQITQQNGMSGSGSNIIIRGYTSITGDNQPLFIVDGVPFNTSNNNTTGSTDSRNAFGNGQNNGSSRFLDIDPDNIESINVLKGFAASTLYGMQGRNGVVLITTKTGANTATANKMSVSVTQSLFANQVASLADYQDEFGNGFNQSFGWFFSNWGPNFRRDGIGGWDADRTVFEDPDNPRQGLLPHPYSRYSSAALRAAFPEYQPGGSKYRYEYKPYESVKNFFRTGLVSNTSVSAQGRSQDGNTVYSMTFGYLNDQGFTPGNELERLTFSVGGRTKLANGLNMRGTMNLVKTDYTTPPIAASNGSGLTSIATSNVTGDNIGGSVFGHVFFTPRSIDMINLPYEHPVTKQSTYYRGSNNIQHPLWTVKNTFVSQLNYRIYGRMGIGYDIVKGLNIDYRLGYDVYSERNENGQNKGGIDGEATGGYRTLDNVNVIWDHTLSVNGDYSLGNNFGLNFNVGVTARTNSFSQQGVSSVNQIAYGTFRHFNFSSYSFIQRNTRRNILGVYGQIEGNYRGYVFLTVAGRNDAVSNFSSENRSLFYPSVSAAVLISEIFPSITTPKGLNFFKLRAGYGTTAGFRDGYPVASVVGEDAREFLDASGAAVASNYAGTQLGNPNLKPEQHREIEVGIEARVWDNRITLDMSWYDRTARNLIISRPLDPATGYTRTLANLGEVTNKGIEIDLGVDAVRTSQVTWNVRGNFTRNRSRVEDTGSVSQLSYTGFSNLGNFAVKGEPLGIIMGSRVSRVPDDHPQVEYRGRRIVDSRGNYQTDQGIFKIGDPNPDFTCNISTSVSYKNFTLAGVFNWIQGGDMYSYTIATLFGRGLVTGTEDRLGTYILPGVIDVSPSGLASDAPRQYATNDLQINNSDFYFGNLLYGPSELQVYDATTVRLQEISLSYSIPKTVLERTPFGSVTLVASGYNLWYRAVNMPRGVNFDPNVAGLGVGNGQGFDFLNGPSSRRFGGTVKFTF